MDSVVVCRYGELFLKSGNRRVFERALADNARRALADMPAARVSQTHGRLLVRLPEAEADDAATRLQRVFGLVSLSVARQVDATADLAAIEATAVDTARAAIARDGVASFKIEARRADKRFPVSSMEIARRVGAARAGGRPAWPSTSTRPRCAWASRSAPAWRSCSRAPRPRPVGCPSARRAARCCCCRAASIHRSRAGWPPSAAWRWTRSTSTRRRTSARNPATRC